MKNSMIGLTFVIFNISTIWIAAYFFLFFNNTWMEIPYILSCTFIWMVLVYVSLAVCLDNFDGI